MRIKIPSYCLQMQGSVADVPIKLGITRRLNLTQNELKIKYACVTSDTATSCVYWRQIEILRKTLDQIR